jgi:hypothetical protein
MQFGLRKLFVRFKLQFGKFLLGRKFVRRRLRRLWRRLFVRIF